MDIEIVNNGDATNIVDAYHVYCRRDVSNNDWPNLQQSFNQGFAELATISGGVAINPAIPGVSPFDAPNFVEKFKIFKKERLVLSPGQVASFVVKDLRKRKIESTDSNEYTLLRGQKGILFVFSAAVNAGTIPIAELDFSVNRSYHYYEIESAQEAGAQQ